MKAIKRIQVFLLTAMLCFDMTPIHASAASSTQDGLEVTLTTDKETYSQGEQIAAVLTVTNTNKAAVHNVFLEHAIPEGYRLAAGTETMKQVKTLGVGESVTLPVTYVTDNADNNPGNGDNPGNSGNSGTGDNFGLETVISSSTSESGSHSGNSSIVKRNENQSNAKKNSGNRRRYQHYALCCSLRIGGYWMYYAANLEKEKK